MKKNILKHIASIAFVAVIFIAVAIYFQSEETENAFKPNSEIESFLNLRSIDWGNPLHQSLFKETIEQYYPRSSSYGDSLLNQITHFRQQEFSTASSKTGGKEQGLTLQKLGSLADMFASFTLIYVIVMWLTYYCARSIAVYRFVKMKQGSSSYLIDIIQNIKAIRTGKKKFNYENCEKIAAFFIKAATKGFAYLILFSPAYVIAYSFKTTIDTSSEMFMIALAVISNGLVITYANKFYTLLVAESRKGYVETALVKNLYSSYEWNAHGGIPLKALFKFRKSFASHVFEHIYVNARYQYIPTLKEHASFLITGLIIIEMALNIQGHLCYELLQNILYRQYAVAAAIIFGIFLLVKATEMAVDFWFALETRHYENKN